MLIVELEYYQNPKSDLFNITGISTYINTSQIYFDPIKSSIIFFLNEILQKTLKTKESDIELLSFIISRMKYLDLTDRPINFHLFFLLDYAGYLGFYPKFDEEKSNHLIFDLKEGTFVETKPNHSFYVKDQESRALREILGMNFDDSNTSLDLHGVKRSRLLGILTDYYRIQIEDFGTCKTLEVLETIFRD